MADLNRARQEIDRIDKEMARLFEERMAAASEVAAYKKEFGLPIYLPEREAQVITQNLSHLTDDRNAPGYIAFLKKLMEISRAHQTTLLAGMRVGYSGVKGAFAEIAAERIFPGCQPVPYGDFSKAYEACENGEVDCCVLPLENSTAGEVGAVTDLMFSGSLHISGVYNLPIRHHLLALPGASIDRIQTVISHPQALAQCAEYIKSHSLTPLQSLNTALAAKQVAEGDDPTIAAIASDKTAALYGLSIVEHNIQEASGNTTRFAVFTAKKPSIAGSGKDLISAFLFTVRNEAGALANAIGIIGRHGMNLRCLRSRPMHGLDWKYYFYAELDGNIESDEGKWMLRELSTSCDRLKVAGVYREGDLDGTQCEE